MARTGIALVLGVLLGVGGTLWLAPSPLSPPPADPWLPTEAAGPAASAVAPAVEREATRNFYRELAEADATELAALIRETAARAPSTDRTLALAVLFRRYAELDAVPAVRLAREVQAGGTALGVVYGAWARAAPEQVLTALSTVSSEEDATEVALALIAALGGDAAAVRRVAAVLVARDGEAALASTGPMPAPVVAVPRSALALTAQRWAGFEPRRALAIAGELDDERVRVVFESAALRALAREAPDEAFAHLASLDPSALQSQLLSGTLVELASAEPERVLNAVRDFPTDLRRMVEMTALQQLAARDPMAAMRHLDRASLGPERQMLLQLVARAYGKRDAAAALAWARENRGDPMLVSAVIGGVAESDPDRALDLALALTSPMERMQAVQFAVMTGARDDAQTEATVNRLLALDDPALRDNMASMAISMWAQRSPQTAMGWLLAHSQVAPPSAFSQLGQQLALRDPQNALGFSAQVPESAREPWANGVALGLAQSDPRGAIDWLGRFRGEQWYAGAAGMVAMTVAQRDGAAAAQLFDELKAGPAAVQPQLFSVIATNWANRDPAAAADWALQRGTEQERQMVVRNVAATWSNQDVDGARQWTLRLPQGATRDAALSAVLIASVMQRGGSTIDAGLLNAFASSQAQQTAVLQVVQQVAYSGDATRARTLADAHLEAPFRDQAERMMEAARNQPRYPLNIGVSQGIAPARLMPVAPPRAR
jgi:hypothetical protein